MKKILLFLSLVLFSLGTLLNAQSTYLVANGTATNSYLPVYGTWMDANQHDQFIYPASLLGPLPNATISKITFYATSASSSWGTATCTVSLGIAADTNYASAAYNSATLTQVYTGSIAVVNNLLEFTFTTPYVYTGGNLLVDITTVTSGSYSGVSFYGISRTNGGLYQYGTNSPVLQSFIPKMGVQFTGGTPMTETYPATSVFATTTVFNGNFYAITPTAAGFQYMVASSTDWSTATVVNATTLTAPMTETVSGLTPTTQYKYRAFASDGTTTYYGGEFTFTTLALPAQLPYACDFENPTENAQWTLINGTQYNKFFIGDASFNPAVNNTVGGSNALYISNDTLGAVWAYSGTGSATNSWVYAYRDFEVPAGVTELKLDFDWIANGGVATSEFLRVYWMPTSIPVTAGSIPPTINSVNYDLTAMIGNYTNGYGSHWLSRQTTWQHAQFTINTTQYPTLAGSTWRMYVHWRNNQTSAVQPPATFDNMTLVVSNCPVPRIDSVSNITSTSGDIYFTEMGTATAWNVQYRVLGTTQWSSATGATNPFLLTGLQASTSYEIRMQSDCLSEQSAWSPIKKFNTACGPITQIPWVDYFDNYGTGSSVFPICWTRKSNVSYPYISTTNYTAPASMYFYAGSSGNYNIASTPMIDATIPINTLMLNFYFRASGLDDTLYVGVMTDPLVDTTFTLVGKFVNSTTGVYLNKVLYMNQYQGTGQYISFKTRYGASSSTIYVDNLQILPMPTCLIPNTISTSNITAYNVNINWLPGDANQTAWFIYYKPTAATTWDSVEVFSSPYLLDNLLPSTNYQYYLRTNCGTELSEATVIGTFTTQCIPVSTLPWNDGFESISAANQLPACWAASSLGSYTFTQITNYNSYNRNARTGTAAAYFRYGCNDRFFTPGFQLTAGVAYKFSYWYVTDGLSGWTSLQAGAYSAQNAGGLIQTMNTIAAPTNGTYQEVVCYFTPTTDGVYYFGIYCQSTSSPWYLTIDDITVDLAPDCLPAQSLAVTNIAGTSAFVNWVPSGTPDFFTVALSPAGQNTWTTYTTTSNQYVLSGLNELTAYDVQVYPNCSGIDGPADTVTFTTICAAGGDLIIGTPTATTSTNGAMFPTQTYYNYSYTQQLFDAAELSALDTIHSIAFQYFFGTAETRNLTIYMGHTMQSTFTGVSNFIPVDSMTIVYQGPVALTNAAPDNWVTINLTTPFDYNTLDNLVIAVRDMTGTYANSGDKFRTHSVTGNKGIYFYQDASAIDPVNPTALTTGVSTFRSNIKISLPCETVSCYQPNVIVNNVTSGSATFLIVPGGTETTWEGEYKTTASSTWISLGNITASPYTLPGLASNTAYQVRFRSVCGASDVSTWKMVAFTTLCGTINQLPFTENFDSYGTGTEVYPTCWTRNSTYGANPYVTTTYAMSTPNSFYFYSSSTTYSMIVLPPVDATIPLNTLQLTLWARISTAGNNLQVGVMTNPNDATTFTLVSTVAPASLNTMEELTVSFANYTGTGVYIAIKSDLIAQSLTNIVYTDNYTLDLIPTCVKPTNVLFSDIYPTSVTASWTPATQAPGYEVVYGLPGIDPNTATPILVTDTFYTMTSLTANTLYHFYVRAMCSATDTSDWTFLRTFRTACDAITTLPWSDYFDTYGTGSTIFPQCWTRNTTQTDRPYINSTNFSAPGSMYFYAGSAGVYNIAATPLFDPSIAINTLKAEFKYRTTFAADTIYVGVMTNPLDASTFVQVAAIGNTTTSTWYDKEVNFSSYTGTGHYIAFKNSNATTYSYGYIDNLDIMLIPTCPRPTSPTVTNATATSVDMNWTEVGSATSWQIEYGAPGFTLGTGTQVVVSAHPYTIPSLTSSTMYDFYVRAICGAGDTSIWSVKVAAGTAQVPANVPVTFDFETASGFQFANNATGNNWYVGTATNNTTGGQNAMYISNDNGVTNAFTNTQIAVVWAYRDVMFTPSTADYTFSFDWKALAESCCDYINVYIGDVTTPVASSSSTTINIPAGATTIATNLNSQTTWQTVTYTLPSATFSGQVKRVFFCWKNDSSVGDNPPAAIDNISITTSTPVCAVPTNLAVSGITSSTANATWTPGGTEAQWQIAYKPTAAGTWITAFTTAPNYALPSLTAATAYDVKVRAICGAGDTSAYTAIVNFTTLATSCPAPTNLAASAITTTGATITWTPGGTETAWELEYKMASASTWITVNVTTTSHNLTTLTPSTAYNVRVRAICGAGNNSDWSAIVNFTTATPPCLMPTNVLVPTATITDQAAVVTWTAAAGQTQWQVEYKLVSSSNWTTMSISTSTTQPIVALQSNSTYEVRVKALCSATNESPFTTPVQFTTTGAVTYIITATATGQGTITPSGSVIVAAGANQTFTFTPTGSGSIVSLHVDNQPATYANNEYTFTNVLANHSIAVEFTNAIDENGLAKLVELYPNPTNATIEIRLNEAQLQVNECRVYDIYGKLMSIVPVNADNTKIDATDFAAGVYFIRMNSEMGVITKKFVKK